VVVHAEEERPPDARRSREPGGDRRTPHELAEAEEIEREQAREETGGVREAAVPPPAPGDVREQD